MSRFTPFIALVAVMVGISGLAVEVEAVRPFPLHLSLLGYSLFLSWTQIVLLALFEIALGSYFLILLHQEEQQEQIVIGQA